MDSDPRGRRDRIRAALLGDDATLIQAYRTSAAFGNALDSFCAMLPSMVLGLAGTCLKEDGERHQQMLDLMKRRMTAHAIRPGDLGFGVDIAPNHPGVSCADAHPGRPHRRPAPGFTHQESSGITDVDD